MGKQTNTAVMVAIIAAVGFGSYALYRSVKGEPVFAAGGGEGQGGLFDLLGISGPPGEANSEQLPAPVGKMEGQEGTMPPLTLSPEEAAKLEVAIPAISETGDSWYERRDIENILGWTPTEYRQRYMAYIEKYRTTPGASALWETLTAQELYAFGKVDTMAIAERSVFERERIFELGGYWNAEGSLTPPPDFPGSGAVWLARIREAGLLDVEPPISTYEPSDYRNIYSGGGTTPPTPSPTSSSPSSNYRNVYSGGGDVMAHFRDYG